MDELIIFIIRETGWTLDYTTELVKNLPIKKLNAFIKELQYQKSLEDYKIASNFALIVATMASSSKRKYKVTDIIGRPPQREVKKDVLTDAAKREGIILKE